MKCANCAAEALYVYDFTPLSPTPYCEKDLPRSLQKLARAGLLTTTEAFAAARESAKATLSAHRTPEESVTAPAPKRRTRRRSSAEPTETVVEVQEESETPSEEPANEDSSVPESQD